MYLGDLIKRPEAMDAKYPGGIIELGFGYPDSYRGYYEQLAFDPVGNAKISDMLTFAKSAVGQVYQGYKGGEYLMSENTECWIAEYGSSGNEINELVVALWEKCLELSSVAK